MHEKHTTRKWSGGEGTEGQGGREGRRDLEVDLQGEDLVLDVAPDAALGVLPHALLEEVRLALR